MGVRAAARREAAADQAAEEGRGRSSVYLEKVMQQLEGEGSAVPMDDFHTPVWPHDYTYIRLRTMLEFYRERIPKKQAWRWFYKIVAMTCATAAAVLARYSASAGTGTMREYLAASIMIVTAVGAGVATFAEFNDSARKLERYSRAMTSLENLLAWWESLDRVRQVKRESIRHLVSECEQIVAGERLSWHTAFEQRQLGGKDGVEAAADAQAADGGDAESGMKRSGNKVAPSA